MSLAAILLYLLPRLHIRALEKPLNWECMIKQRQSDMNATSWGDSRPLTILLGDSHMELGDWYNLFHGTVAVRNCGMSMARIQDVTALASSVPDKHPKTVVLMCGINNFFQGATVEACVPEYEALFNEIRRTINPQSLLILAVMPVRENPLNQKVQALNVKLESLCQAQQITFINVNASVSEIGGGLSAQLTDDGLHLNRKGYRAFASEILKRLPQ